MQRWSCTQHKTDAPPPLSLPLSIVPHWQDLTPASATLQLTRGGGWRGTAQLYLFPTQPSPHSGLTECLLKRQERGKAGGGGGRQGRRPRIRQPLSVQGKLLYLSMPSFSQLENGRNICFVELFQGLKQLTFTKHLEKYLALSNF